MTELTLPEFLLARFLDDDGGKSRWWQLIGRRVLINVTPDWMLRRMAATRSDHPDYDEAWRP